MSYRMVSRGTRSSGLEEVPSKAPGSKSATPANGMTSIFHDMFFRRKIVNRLQHFDEIAAGKGRGTIMAN